MPNYRNPVLLDLARECDTCCCCHTYVGEGFCCGAHSNSQQDGKGTGLKSHDIVAFACKKCHDLIDRRTGDMPLEDRQAMLMRGVYNTFLWLLQNGKLKVIR